MGGIIVRRMDPSSIVLFDIHDNVIDGSHKGITVIDTDGSKIINNYVSNCNVGIREATLLAENATNNSKIMSNTLANCTTPISTLGANTKIEKNFGYKTENSRTATIPQLTTSIVVDHGLTATPTRINVTPFGDVGYCWVPSANITATEFTIYCSTAPVSDTIVSWSAQVV